MAKTGGVSLADLIAGQKNQDVKMSSYMQAQLDSQLNTEKVIKDTHKINTITAVETSLSKQDEDKIKEDIHKGLLAKTGDGLNSNMIKMAKDIKESLKLAKAASKPSKEKLEGLTGMAENVKVVKSVSDKIADFKKGFLDKYGPKNIGTTALKAMNVSIPGMGGIFDKRIAQNEYINQQRELGSRKSEKNLRGDWAKRNEVAKSIQKNESEIERFKKETGLKESDIGKTSKGKELLSNRDKLAEKFGRYDKRSKLLDSGDTISADESRADRITAGPKAPAVDPSESDIENLKVQQEQHDLLAKIEENTRPGNAAAAGGGGEGGGGILAGIGKGLGALGTGLGKLGSGIGKGIRGILVGLAEGIVALGAAVATGVGALGLAALAGIILAIGKALEWAAPAIQAFAPVLLGLVSVIGEAVKMIGGVLIEGIKALPGVITAVAEGVMNIIGAIADGITSVIDAVTTSIERLAAIDGSNLLQVGAGLLAVAAGMGAFAVANVASGISNMATGLMGAVSGQKTPVEQLEQIAKFGPNLNQAGTGVKNLASGLAQFTNIDGDKLKVISQMPVDKIVAMGTAMGQAGMVYDRSAKNREAASITAQPAAPTVVSAPTVITNSTQQQGFFNTPIRNQDNTLNSYLKSRYVN